jgi:hypothetical protein
LTTVVEGGARSCHEAACSVSRCRFPLTPAALESLRVLETRRGRRMWLSLQHRWLFKTVYLQPSVYEFSDEIFSAASANNNERSSWRIEVQQIAQLCANCIEIQVHSAVWSCIELNIDALTYVPTPPQYKM